MHDPANETYRASSETESESQSWSQLSVRDLSFSCEVRESVPKWMDRAVQLLERRLLGCGCVVRAGEVLGWS